MRAKKSLGQNFLSSTQIISDIVSASKIEKGDIVLEVGPGKGILTKKLLSQGVTVVAVEKDKDLIPRLTDQFAEEILSKKLKLIHGDILELFSDKNYKLLTTNSYKVVANIPYYITGQILRMLLSGERQPLSITLVVQKEVAQRIVAKDGKESVLSLSVKVYGSPSYVRKIPAHYFNPKPKVDSAIVHIDSLSKKNFKSPKDELFFFDLIKTGFSHKRKLLLKNLKKKFNKETLENTFILCNIPSKTRAEDVSFDKWLCLFKYLKKYLP